MSTELKMTEKKNILVIGHHGSGKSLLSATLADDYETFPISNDVERFYDQENEKFIRKDKVKDCFTILDWEGPSTPLAFKKLLDTFEEK